MMEFELDYNYIGKQLEEILNKDEQYLIDHGLKNPKGYKNLALEHKLNAVSRYKEAQVLCKVAEQIKETGYMAGYYEALVVMMQTGEKGIAHGYISDQYRFISDQLK